MKKQYFKRILSLLMAVATVAVLCPVTPVAKAAVLGEVTACPSCGTALSELTYTDWDGTGEVTGDCHYRLTKNISLFGDITVSTGVNLVLDLNGFCLTAAKNSRVFMVSGGILTVLDSSEAGTGALVGGDVSGLSSTSNLNAGGTIHLGSGGTFNLLSGTVRDGYGVTGGNIYCAKGTTLNITGGTVTGGYAVAISSSTGRGGNIYTQATTEISGNARILNGYAQYGNISGTNNSGRGGNLFVHNGANAVIKGDAVVAGGYAGWRGGNILVNYHATLTVQENAEIYGGTAKKYANNLDVMTATFNMEGGTIYGSPAGGAATNILAYSTESVFNITGGKIYGKIQALPGMTINISGKPYVEHLYLPQTVDASGNETARALIVPGTFEEGAWVGLEVQAEDQIFTGPLEDFSSYMFFFHYDKSGLTWYKRGGDQSLYLTTGTPCQCCGEDVTDIQWKTITTTAGWMGLGTLTAGHYKLTNNINLKNMMTPAPGVIDASGGYVTLDLNGYTIYGPTDTQVFNFSEAGTFNIVDNTKDKAGAIKGSGAYAGSGGVISVNKTGSVLNIYSGTLTGSVTGDNNTGGTIYVTNSSVLNLYNGTIADGVSQDHGGNIYASGSAVVNIYGGEVTRGTVNGGTAEDGSAFVGHGGNIYLTGRSTTLNIYNGLIADGTNYVGSGGNIQANTGSNVNMYAGTVENGGAVKYGANLYVSGSTGSGSNIKYSQFYMYGGTLGASNTTIANIKGLSVGTSNNILQIFNGTVAPDQNVHNFIAPCACYRAESTATYIWNYGHNEKTCDISCQMEEVWGKVYVQDMNTGIHDYSVKAGSGECTCTVCNYTFYQENMVAVVGGKIFESLNAAIAKAEEGSTITMLGDTTETAVVLSRSVSLNLNGFTLTADSFTSTNGTIVDSTGGKGCLVSDSVALAADNAHLPVSTAEGLRFGSLTPDHTLERLDNDTVRVRFVFREHSTKTLMDNLIREGNTDISVQFKLTWTDSAGKAKTKTYVADHSLLQKYAQKWDGRRYVATITGVNAVSDLTCTIQLTSKAASGVTLSATTLNNVNFINQKLTWDAINSYPIKTKDMTVDELRQAVLDFMYFTKTYVWTPDQTVNYVMSSKDSLNTMNQGQLYGGLPYVGLATGNVYRMMDYINPETGLVDMEKALPSLKDGGTLSMSDLKYFGSQCSVAVYWGWGRVINSANYSWTGGGVPKNDFIILGDVAIPEGLSGWSLAYNTVACCEENGKQTMFEAYALLQGADGLVQWTTAGHFAMAFSDAVVVRNSDGTINGDKSYVMVIDQAATWKTLSNDAGDTFTHKNNVNVKWTFTKLFNSSYIPFTFKEFTGEASVEDTTVSLTKGETTYITGTIRESDRKYIASATTETLAWNDIFSSRVRSNYGIVDVYVTIYNAEGQQIYRHAVRTGTAGNKNLAMEETGDMVTIWQNATVFPNRTYAGSIEVQLATGERVVIFDGNITT